MNKPIELGKRIAELRTRQHLSQRQLANAMGKDGSWLARIEKGRVNPTFSTLCEIAGALGIDLAVLVSDE